MILCVPYTRQVWYKMGSVLQSLSTPDIEKIEIKHLTGIISTFQLWRHRNYHSNWGSITKRNISGNPRYVTIQLFVLDVNGSNIIQYRT